MWQTKLQYDLNSQTADYTILRSKSDDVRLNQAARERGDMWKCSVMIPLF